MSFDRNTPGYKQWRGNVLLRDGYKCVICGSEDNLEAHHVKPVAKFPDLALDINNGITLCQRCHYEEHNRNYNSNLETVPSLINTLHPFFRKLRDITYYMSYRTGIVKRFWKELPLPRKFKRYIEKIIVSLLLLAFLILMSIIGKLF